MSETKLRQIATLLFHSMMLLQTSAGCSFDTVDVAMDNYDIHLNISEGEVTICEAQKTFNLKGQ